LAKFANPRPGLLLQKVIERIGRGPEPQLATQAECDRVRLAGRGDAKRDYEHSLALQLAARGSRRGVADHAKSYIRF